MKKTLLLLSALMLVLASCRKDDVLDVDMNQFNTDQPVANDIDRWIAANLVTPYNIDVVYRYNRNLTDVSKDISPIELDRVRPVMEAVLNGYLKPYEKVAGKTFIKTFTPKQYVLYGSVAYNTNGSVTLGTADGGRRVVLYDLNNFTITDVNSESGVRRKLRTIHHEFTHILNQNVVIPPEFEAVTKADYYTDWTNAANTEALAKSLGYISRYARSQYGEDFAEMVAHLLVEGQVWFDNYLISAPIDAQVKLRRKEELVVQYFKNAFDINFRTLQAEIQGALKTIYGAQDPVDLTQTFAALLGQNRVSTLTFDPAASHYAAAPTGYGNSTVFNTTWTNFKNGVETQNPTANRRYPTSLQLLFTSASTMTLRINYLNNAQTSTLQADYDFNVSINTATSDVIFTKAIPEGTTTAHSNGQTILIKPFFEQFLLPYFTNRVFVAGWLPTGISSTNPLYKTFAGFSEKGVPANYFYGPIVLK